MFLTDDLLLNYQRCTRRAFLNVYGNRLLQDPERDFLLKLRQESMRYSIDTISTLTKNYHQLQAPQNDLVQRAKETKILMAQGVDYIYDGVLLVTNSQFSFVANPTLLVKQLGFSRFGSWAYYPLNINFGRRPKKEYKIISTFHSYVLALFQGVLPSTATIILRPYNSYSLDLEYWLPQLQQILQELREILSQEKAPEVFISRQKCSLCRWYSHCYATAKSENHLSLIPGVTPNRYQYLKSLDIKTVESLASNKVSQLEELIGDDITAQLQLQAQSVVNKVALRKSLDVVEYIPNSPVNLYFDIEAEPELNLDYLLGVLVIDSRNRTEKFYSFLAEKPEDEPLIWSQFLDLVNNYPKAPIFHYSNYEQQAIKRLAKLYKTPTIEIKNILYRCIDLHQQTVDSVVLPIENYSLKSVANWLGFTWKIPEARGDQSVCWYDQWLKTGDYTLLENILSYNQDDCWATYYLKEWLAKFLLA